MNTSSDSKRHNLIRSELNIMNINSLRFNYNNILSKFSLKRSCFSVFCICILLSLSNTNAQLSVIIENAVSAVNPGDVVAGRVLISNLGGEEQDLVARLYLQDFVSSVEGDAYRDLEEGSNVRTNLPWTRLSTTQIVVPNKTTVEVPFQIIVPNDPDLLGSYWGVIMVEGEPEMALEADPEVPGSIAMQIINRHALSIIVDIGDGFAELSFSNPQLLTQETSLFEVDVNNIGNKIIRPETYLEFYSETGDFIGRVDGNLGRIRPNNPKRLTFDLTTIYLLNSEGEKELVTLPLGNYATNLIADADGFDIFGVRYNLEFGAP